MKKTFLLFILVICSITLFAQSEDWFWAKQVGGTSDDSGNSIAVDAYGNSYVTGIFRESATFGSTTLTSSGYQDIFVAKLDYNGNWLWAKQAGGTSDDCSRSIAIDDNGNCYIIGYFYGNATFGATTLTSSGYSDIFIAKLDSNGNWLWAKQAGGTNEDYGYSIAVDSNGNSYVTGVFYNATFGTTLLISSGGYDIFVAKLDSNGNWLWAKKAGGTSSDGGYSIAVDSNGNSYVTGYFYSSRITFGTITLIKSGSSSYNDIFVAKLDSNGNWLWVKQAGGTSYDYGYGIAVDDNGNSYVTGYFGSSIATLGTTTLTSSGSYDIFVAKLDSNGNWLWAKNAGGIEDDYGYNIAVDANGNSYVTGYFNNNATFGATTLTSIGYRDIFVTKLDSNGNWLWAKIVGGTGSDEGYGIAIDVNGNSYVTGCFEENATFGNTTLTSSGNSDIFIFKIGRFYQVLVPNGGEQWRTGSTKTIYWNFDIENYVNIQLSLDNGANWIMLNSSPVEAALGRFSFTVPYVSSSNCLIKVVNSENSNYFDISDETFTISNSVPYSLSLTAPNYSKLQAGRNYSINWTASGITIVNLAYSCDAGLTWDNIATALPANPGTYEWTVPDISALICYLKVSDAAHPAVYDWSDQAFSICKLNLLSPIGGEIFQSGSIINISWQSELIQNIKIEYSTNGDLSWQDIITSLPASTGNYAWTNYDISSNQYLIRISDVIEPTVYDLCDNTFTVICYINLLYPSSSNIKMQAGRQYNITWEQEILTGNITLALTTDNVNYSIIASGIPVTQHSYFWTVPDTPSTTCKIKITSELDNQIYDCSDNNFTICKIQLIIPNGLEVWGAESIKNISWSVANVSNLKLEYSSDNGNSWLTIANDVSAAAGSYSWTLPDINSSQCLIKISDSSDNTFWDISDNLFTIRPQITIIAPNGNEYFSVNSIYSILWSSTADVPFVLIDYSIDGGVNWLPIHTSPYPASVGRYDWLVPNNPSANCLVKVRNFANSAIFDVSDEVFTITPVLLPPTVNFTADVTSGLQPLEVHFTDQSTAGTGNINFWNWDFGNGDNSNEQHPVYVYQDPGVYSVTLTVTNSADSTASLTRENYITVIQRVPEIEVNPPTVLNFGVVYLGSSSAPSSVVISNTGTAELLIDNLSWEEPNSLFSFVNIALPIAIPAGEEAAISLLFIPQAAGTVSDNLFIHNNSVNSPLYTLELRGTGEYVPPKPPNNLVCIMDGYDAVLTWDAVTETIFDTPVVPDYYLVFYNDLANPYGEFYFLGSTLDLTYTHSLVGLHAPYMFYRVVAYKFYGRGKVGIEDLGLSRGMTETEVRNILKEAETRISETRISGFKD